MTPFPDIEAKAFAQAVKDGNAYSFKLDKLSYLEGSGQWATQQLGKEGIQFEIDFTQQVINRSENVQEVNRGAYVGARQVTDIDIVTDTRLYQVKAKPWAAMKAENLENFETELARLRAQLVKTKNDPLAQGRQIVFKSKYPIASEVQEMLDSIGGIILE